DDIRHEARGRGIEDPDARLEAEQRPLALGAGTSAEGALSEEIAARETEDRLDADIRVLERLSRGVEHFPREPIERLCLKRGSREHECDDDDIAPAHGGIIRRA